MVFGPDSSMDDMNGESESIHISTEEAEERKLPGWDVYKRSHLIYRNDINRDAGVAYLCQEAYKIFCDTILIRCRKEYMEESAAFDRWSSSGIFDLGLSWPADHVTMAHVEFMNLEHFKLASGFELVLKSILLEKNHVLQKIKNMSPYETLSKKQKCMPIDRNELIGMGGYKFDGKMNYLHGLSDGSLYFGDMMKKKCYRQTYGIDEPDLDLIEEYRILRNQIHFPGDPIETPKRAAHPKGMIDFLVDFINHWVVERHDRVVEKHRFIGNPMRSL